MGKRVLDLAEGRVFGFSVAVSGTSYAQRTPTAALRVDTYLVNAKRTILVDIAGQGDVDGGLTAQQIYDAAVAYKDARMAAGVHCYAICTVPHATIYAAGEQTARLAYNDLLRASDEFDVVIDLAARPEMQDASNLTYWDADGIHPNPAGAAVIAEEIADALWGAA